MPRTVRRSRSRPTSTRSTVSWRKNGIVMAKTSRREPPRLADLGDVLEGHALERRRKPKAHRREVGAMPVEGGDHREAGDAALGRLALQDHGDLGLQESH